MSTLSTVLLFSFIIAILINYLRFKTNESINKIMLLISCLVIIEIQGFLFHFDHTDIFMFFFVGLASYSFRVYEGLIASFVAWILIGLQSGDYNLYFLFCYIVLAILIKTVFNFLNQKRIEHDKWLNMLIYNSKQLNVIREVSISLQQTHHLEKLLKIILTSVTAGHGLGFNRAMILLLNEEETILKGAMGTGPLTSEEGYSTWDNIAKNKYRLSDLIKIKEEEKSTDPELNQETIKLVISLENQNIFHQALDSERPIHIKKIDHGDNIQQLFHQTFNMNEFVICPLIYQGKKTGVLMIDNIVNKRPISISDIDSVIPLANQAASAIQQSQLYSKVEDLALKDGLTGLLNQRAFQNIIEEQVHSRNQNSVSLILLDIDFFKHFNDTNGHLLGNEVLKQLSNVMTESIREDDLAFRFGGEEFVVLLLHTELDEAYTIAEKVRRNIENTSFPCGEKQPNGRLTVSIGVSSTNEINSTNSNHLINTADQALYKAKEAGKNKVISYGGKDG